MTEAVDVVIVGARCAGSPLATMLARDGVSVALLDRADFPSDTLSTHLFQNEAAKVLESLGVLAEVLASGAPSIEQVDLRLDGLRVTHPIPRRPEDPGTWLCVRRSTLDKLLIEAAREAGVRVHTSSEVTGLVEEDGRVSGVRVRSDGDERLLRAALVVGADGRGSTVARHAGARSYNLIPSQRFAYWGYYEVAPTPTPGTSFLQRWEEELLFAAPADGGLHLVAVLPPKERLAEFRADADAAFDAYVAGCEPVAAAVAGGRRVGKLQSMSTWTGYFRESAGPGWVLAGDAGHFKDPSPGQGIADALRQVDRLAPDIVTGLGGGPTTIDDAMAKWWRWRDRDAAEMAWFAGDLGAAGRVPPVLVAAVTDLVAEERFDAFLDIFNHRVAPLEVLTPPRLMAATAQLLARGEHPRREILRQTKEMVAEEIRRKRLNRHPEYAGAQDPV